LETRTAQAKAVTLTDLARGDARGNWRWVVDLAVAKASEMAAAKEKPKALMRVM
jgi:hypothetical protein